MKIILLIQSLGGGGAERSTVELAKFLRRNDIEVTLLCLAHTTVGLEKEVIESDIPTIFYEGKKDLLSKAVFISKTINQEDPDIVHSVLIEADILLRFSRFFCAKGKIVQSLVSTPYCFERKKDPNLPWFKFQIVKQVDRWSARLTPKIFYHCISKEVLIHYRFLFGIKNNYRVVYRGRNTSRFPRSRKNQTGIFQIVNVGRQEFAKGQIDILKAIVYLRDERGLENIHLKILGKTGYNSDQLNEFINTNSLKDQVTILGFVNNVEEEITTADAFVFPSYYEGLGGALIEAMAAKLPIICSAIPVLKEVIGKEDGALFQGVGDHIGLAENIIRLVNDEDLRKRLSYYSYERFQSTFNISSVHQEMLEMYENIMEND